MDTVLEAKEINFAYEKNYIIENLSTKIEKGKFISIIGPNGSGKTTLLKLFLNILNRKSGKIFLKNRDIRKYKRRDIAKNISYVPQKSDMNFDFNVEEIVSMGRAPYIHSLASETEKDRKIIKNSMLKTDVYDLKNRSIQNLSGGEFQRVIIARAITQDTEIMLLDEPISHLDIHHQIEILDTLKNLNKNENITIVLILHDINMAIRYSDKIILMDKGKIMSQGIPDKVVTEENLYNIYKMNFEILISEQEDTKYIIPKRRC